MFWQVTQQLLEGFESTLKLFCITLVAALPLGLIISFGSMSKFRPLKWLCKTLIWIIRGTPLGDLVDFEAEAKRLQKELAAAEEKLAFINKKLDNPGFVNKAPEKVVQQNRDEAAKLTEKIANLRSSLENLGK